MASSVTLDLLVQMRNEAQAPLKALEGQLAAVEKQAASVKNAMGGMMDAVGKIGLAVFGAQQVAQAVGGITEAMISGNAQMETYTAGFQVLLGTQAEATARMQELAQFAAATPFDLPEIAAASRQLQVMGGTLLATGKNLTMVGDMASAANNSFADTATWVGRAYSAIQSGRPFGEAAQRLQELGLMSGETRNQLETMQKAGATGAQIWDVFTASMGKFSGMMQVQSQTAAGLTSTVQDDFAALQRIAMQPLFDKAKADLQSLQATLESPGAQQAAQALAGALSGLLGVVTTVAGFVAQNFAPLLLGLATFVLPSLVSVLMTGVVPALTAMATAAWAATGPLGVLAVGIGALAVAWNNNVFGMRDATNSLIDSLGNLITKFGELGQTQQTQANAQGVTNMLRQAGDQMRANQERADLLATAHNRMAGEMAVSAAMAQHTADANAALARSYKQLSDDAAKATSSLASGLAKMAADTNASAKSGAAGITDLAKIIRELPEGVSPEIDRMRSEMQGAFADIAQNGGASAQSLHDQVVGWAQQMAQSADVETRAMGQQILENINVADAAGQVGQLTGDSYVSSLAAGAAGGMPAVQVLLNQMLQKMDVAQITGMLGAKAGRQFVINMEAQEVLGLQATAQVTQAMLAIHAAVGADTTKDQALLGGLNTTINKLNADIHKGLVQTGNIYGDTGKKVDIYADTSAKGHKKASDAAANAARSQEQSAESIIADLGKLGIESTKAGTTAAQAFTDLSGILTKKLPADLKWLQNEYSALLAKFQSDTPPSLAEIAADFETWNTRLRESNNRQWAVLAQANEDGYRQALAAQQAADQQKLDQAAATARQLVQSQEQVLGQLAGLVQAANAGPNSLGDLMSKTADLMSAAADAKMPALVSKLQGYWEQMRAGQTPNLAAMQRDFGAMLDTMAAQGTPKEQAIAQGFRDMWATILTDQQKAQEEWSKQTSATMQAGIAADLAARAKFKADQKAAQDQGLADMAAYVQKLHDAGVGIAGGLGGVGVGLFDPSTFTRPGGMLDLMRQLGPLMQQALDAGMPGVADKLRQWMATAAAGGTVPIEEMVAQIRAALEALAQSTDPLIALQARESLAQLDAAQAAAAYTAAIQAQQQAITADQAALTAAQTAYQDAQANLTALQAKMQALTAQQQKWTSAQLEGTNATNAQQASLKQAAGIAQLAQGALTGSGGNAAAALAQFQAQFAQIQAAQAGAITALQGQIAGASGSQKTDLQARLDQLLATQSQQSSAYQQAVAALQGGGGAAALQALITQLQGQSSQAGLLGGLIGDPLKDALKNIPQEYGFAQILQGETSTQAAMARLTPEIAAQTRQLAMLKENVDGANAALTADQKALTDLQAAQTAAAQGFTTLGTAIAGGATAATTNANAAFSGMFTNLTDLLTFHNEPGNDAGVLGLWGTTPKSLLSRMYDKLNGDNAAAFRPNVDSAMQATMNAISNRIMTNAPDIQGTWGDMFTSMSSAAQAASAIIVKAAQDAIDAWAKVPKSTQPPTTPPPPPPPPGVTQQTTIYHPPGVTTNAVPVAVYVSVNGGPYQPAKQTEDASERLRWDQRNRRADR